nr:MAG TPA: hypothetical protein [Caudoviricetes sp.]
MDIAIYATVTCYYVSQVVLRTQPNIYFVAFIINVGGADWGPGLLGAAGFFEGRTVRPMPFDATPGGAEKRVARAWEGRLIYDTLSPAPSNIRTVRNGLTGYIVPPAVGIMPVLIEESLFSVILKNQCE